METCPNHQDLTAKISALCDKIDDTNELTKEIYVSLRGDLEKRGWLTRIEVLEQFHDECKDASVISSVKAFQATITNLNRIMWASGVFIISGSATFIWALLTHTLAITK